jgi:ectoine hydroxylase-related dioxygenase (phytanoyl-CoA dioxygenase family)
MNLVVFPGSHHLLQTHFQQHGIAGIEGRGWEALPTPEALQARTPEQVCLRAGDAVLLPYLTGHAVAPNATPKTRCMAYFRLFAPTHPQYQYKKETFFSPWEDWAYLRET